MRLLRETHYNNTFSSCRAYQAPFYIGVVVPFAIIYLFNMSVFVIIIVSLIRKNFSSKLSNTKRKDTKMQSFKKNLLIAVTLAVLFGPGWGLGLLVTEKVYDNKTQRDLFASLFVILTAFHGLFIFLVHCVRSREVRNVWKQIFFSIFNKNSFLSTISGRDPSSSTKSTHEKSFPKDDHIQLQTYAKMKDSEECDVIKEIIIKETALTFEEKKQDASKEESNDAITLGEMKTLS